MSASSGIGDAGVSAVDPASGLEPARAAEGPPPIIRTENLHKSFGSNDVLRGIGLDFPTGTTTVILGGSGSGKSVLMKHLIGLLSPDKGRVVVDGEATWAQSIKLCRKGGRVVTCGASSGWDARTDLRHVFFRQIQILGSTMGSKASLLRVAELIGAGKLKPVVDEVFPLAEAAEAHRYLDRREQFGKVVLEVAKSS